MFGEVVYRNESNDYAEFLLAQEEQGKKSLIACIQYGSIKMYRIEWRNKIDYPCNYAQYTLESAIELFRYCHTFQTSTQAGRHMENFNDEPDRQPQEVQGINQDGETYDIEPIQTMKDFG